MHAGLGGSPGGRERPGFCSVRGAAGPSRPRPGRIPRLGPGRGRRRREEPAPRDRAGPEIARSRPRPAARPGRRRRCCGAPGRRRMAIRELKVCLLGVSAPRARCPRPRPAGAPPPCPAARAPHRRPRGRPVPPPAAPVRAPASSRDPPRRPAGPAPAPRAGLAPGPAGRGGRAGPGFSAADDFLPAECPSHSTGASLPSSSGRWI